MYIIVFETLYNSLGAQKKGIACLVWLESNMQLLGFEFGLLGDTQFGFQLAWHSKKKNTFPR
jgi:hypothetical protein